MPIEFRDKRMQSLFQSVSMGIGESVGKGLVKSNLMTPEGKPIEPMTDEGLNDLFSNVFGGLAIVLNTAEVMVPTGSVIDEIGLTDSIVNGSGEAVITCTDYGTVIIDFRGDKPTITNLETPVDPPNAPFLRVETDSQPLPKTLTHLHKMIIKCKGIVEFPPEICAGFKM